MTTLTTLPLPAIGAPVPNLALFRMEHGDPADWPAFVFDGWDMESDLAREQLHHGGRDGGQQR